MQQENTRKLHTALRKELDPFKDASTVSILIRYKHSYCQYPTNKSIKKRKIDIAAAYPQIRKLVVFLPRRDIEGISNVKIQLRLVLLNIMRNV